MLRSTLRKLSKGWGTNHRRPARAPTRRPTLEALEDRMVLSTAHQFGSTLVIQADPGIIIPRPIGPIVLVRHITLEADAGIPTKLDVFDGSTLLGQFTISSIKTVDVSVAGVDAIDLNDSNGLPLQFGSSVNLFGGGLFGNSLNLFGSQPVNPGGGELNAGFTGSTATRIASLNDGGVTVQFFSGITSVADEWINTSAASTLFVNTQGPAVALSGSNGVTEQLSGLADGGSGPGTLIFAGKANILLEAGGIVSLDATAAAKGLADFTVELGSGSTVNIDTTPAGTNTVVLTGGFDRVNVRGNLGFVNVISDPTSVVELGSNDASVSLSVTAGIKQDVSVTGGQLLIADGGNTTTQEHVKVTADTFLSTIAGTGLFGSSSVVVSYQALSSLVIFTGRLPNTYTVAPSHAGVHFTNPITIDDAFSGAGLNVTVDVDPQSGLNLHLFNANPATGSLTFVASAPFLVQAAFNPLPPTKPNGTETVKFFRHLGPFIIPVGVPSTVSYFGFDNVALV
jgi:hypothetical protein